MSTKERAVRGQETSVTEVEMRIRLNQPVVVELMEREFGDTC